jgi:hypothetical protein
MSEALQIRMMRSRPGFSEPLEKETTMRPTTSTDRSSGTGHASRRRIAVGALATLIVTAIPGVALAKPPVHVPPANATTVLSLGVGDVPCGPITITYTDNERTTILSSGVVILTGQLDAVVTSDLNGKSVTLHVSGPAKINPDRSITGGGPWLLFAPHVLAYTNGRVMIPTPLDPNDGPGAPEAVDRVQVKGQWTDLCPLLGF